MVMVPILVRHTYITYLTYLHYNLSHNKSIYYIFSNTDAQQWANYLFGMFYSKCTNKTYTNSDDDYYNRK